jgi:hypothetical protein
MSCWPTYCSSKIHADFQTFLFTVLFRIMWAIKGTVAWDFYACFWTVRMNLGLKVNRLWFLNFNDAPLILDNYFKFWRVSGQTFSEILRISEMNWQLSLRISNFRRFLASGSPPLLAYKSPKTLLLAKNYLRRYTSETFFEEYIYFKNFHYWRHCGLIPV